MRDRLDATLRESCGLRKDKPILVGVSGGPDSLCLLSALHEAGWQVVAAHFNHALREEAAAEAAAVEALCARMGLPFVGGQGDVRQHAAGSKLSIETAARQLRYRFLFHQARQHRAQAVAVGHTADDQVETVLMHFLRGAGLNGLKGMTYRSLVEEYDAEIPVVRPLLDVWRADTVAWCTARELEPHYDRSNEANDVLRNRLRNELIPLLEQYNPRFREAAWRAARNLADDHQLLKQALAPLWQKCVAKETQQYIAFNAASLAEQPAAAQAHLVQRAAQQLVPGLDVGYDALQRALALIGDLTGERTDLAGGLLLLREGSLLYLDMGENALPLDQWPQLPEGSNNMPFPVPGQLQLAAGWRLESALWQSGSPEEPNWEQPGLSIVYLDAGTVTDPLEVRVHRPGDRFLPLGMDGHSQKLSDFLINVKMPRRARARWPLVCSGDAIIWIPGYRPAHPNRIRGEQSRFIELRLVAPSRLQRDMSTGRAEA